ncbi:hypothetical protein GCM10007173_10550 [Glutamicibacter ardleyensis]|uniref:NADH:flavin oxidoreductase/NADH oxidase N-terminal domain-containing protein n=1 Tax=Glutamicibacter ardleyensis TaxID=225894 RepID=A0ABQ2DDI2_9MICC|nr:hypothetical protein GCM10007173_10550 [Glutamicibacter ardleyensis]
MLLRVGASSLTKLSEGVAPVGAVSSAVGSPPLLHEARASENIAMRLNARNLGVLVMESSFVNGSYGYWLHLKAITNPLL